MSDQKLRLFESEIAALLSTDIRVLGSKLWLKTFVLLKSGIAGHLERGSTRQWHLR